MAWLETKDHSFVEDHLRNSVSNKAKRKYQEISQLIVSEFELMLATAESKYQFYVSFLHIVYDQDLFGRKKIAVSLRNLVSALLRNKSKFEDVASRRSLALDNQTLHRGIH